ncbi:MAG: hypothetical protein IJI25_11825 [Eubacterium sp.]|nr:hypothetical protein [Eubacterium sp.]
MSTNIFEEKNIQLAILKLGIPAMVGQLATLIYNLADTYFVSMTRNPAQIAAVTLSTPILLIIMSVSSVCGMAGSIIKIGIPGALITIMLSISNIVLNNYIGIYGSDAVAAYGIAYKIDMFPIMLSVGLSQGIAPLIGYCYGAKQTERLNKVMINGMIDTVLLGTVFTLAFLSLAGPLTSIFLHEKALTSQSALFLRIMGLSAPMLGIINMVTAYYQALGKAVSSLFITVLRNALLFIPCVIILNALFGLKGAISAQPAVETALAVICLVMYFVSRRKNV